MTILARFHNSFDVKITGSVMVGNIRKFCVRTVDGKARFEQNTHGGPAMVDSAIVYREQLSNIRQEAEPNTQPVNPFAMKNPQKLTRQVLADMAEYAPLFPSRGATPAGTRQARGGMNND